MRKVMFSLMVTSALVFTEGAFLVGLPPISIAQQKPIPPYAKWGQLAMKKTHEKYPQAQIVDYLHVGRTTGPQSSVEKFKLWLKDSQREFGVFVDIEFENTTEKVISTKFRESTR
ncbi:YqzG/YhdC family protein [Neobacillus niacini]|uniref:YqzG/YhdC family protein n=1 Tax=Neobacillus niacini TaxID=86668 RepID=UPI0021CB5BC0|nr:YqzG/YhdC family protein [Neobacillus niacini]MCM3765186.1 YqzG/YhdC family protein [Neobacillus niacini]